MKKTPFSAAIALMILPAFSYAESKARIAQLLEQTPSGYCGVDVTNIIRSGGKMYALYGTDAVYDPEFKDQPCSSGTSRQHLAELEQVNGKLRVRRTALLENLEINTRFINHENMKVQNGIWTFINNEYGKDDSNCCPSLVYLNQIRLSDMQLLNRKFIGRKSY